MPTRAAPALTVVLLPQNKMEEADALRIPGKNERGLRKIGASNPMHMTYRARAH